MLEFGSAAKHGLVDSTIGIAESAWFPHDCGVISVASVTWFSSASQRKRWLVGVSGGADSVALLRLLVGAGFRNLIVCHLDHGLRGRASTMDARWVSRLAKELGLECEIGKSDVSARMTERRESMETAARHARHEFFATCAKKYRCHRILLAHHADDQAETVLWNLMRGSHGLKGMRALQKLVTESGRVLQIERPLLGVRHAALVDWLESHGHRWREDASNAEAVVIRNRLRNEVFPLLDDVSGRDAALAFARGASDAVESEELEAWALQQASVIDPQGRLHLPVLRRLPVALQRLAIREFLKQGRIASVDRSVIDRSLSLLDLSQPATVNLPGGARLRRQGGRLWIDP